VLLLLFLLLSVVPTGTVDRHLTNRQSYKYSPFRNIGLEMRRVTAVSWYVSVW